ncbi:MAG: hypothetical protein ACLFUI_11085 [Halanaerobiales bacterium]
MRSVYLNDNGDFEFNSMNEVKMIDGIDEIKQRLKISLITEMKEWFLNLDFGVPWLKMLGEGDPPAEFRKEVLKVLNDEPAVDKVLSIKTHFDRGDRSLEIEFEVRIDDEDVTESVVIE